MARRLDGRLRDRRTVPPDELRRLLAAAGTERQLHARGGEAHPSLRFGASPGAGLAAFASARLAAGSPLLRVPLRFVDAGLNQTLRRGAYLHRVRHALGVRCADAASVPEALEVSCAAGGKGHVYHGTDVALPPGVRLAAPAHAALALAVVKTK